MSAGALLPLLQQLKNKSGAIPTAPLSLSQLKSQIEAVPLSVGVQGLSAAVSSSSIARGVAELISAMGSLSAVGSFKNILSTVSAELGTADLSKITVDQLASALERSTSTSQLLEAVGGAAGLSAALGGYSGSAPMQTNSTPGVELTGPLEPTPVSFLQLIDVPDTIDGYGIKDAVYSEPDGSGSRHTIGLSWSGSQLELDVDSTSFGGEWPIDVSGRANTAGLADTSTNSTLLGGEPPSYYTDVVGRLGYTPLNKAGDTVTGGYLTVEAPGHGAVGLADGGANNVGYVSFYTPDGTRRGYLGWNSTWSGNNYLVLETQNGYDGWLFSTGSTVMSGSLYVEGSAEFAGGATVVGPLVANNFSMGAGHFSGMTTFDSGSGIQLNGTAELAVNSGNTSGQGDNQTHFNYQGKGTNYVRGTSTIVDSPLTLDANVSLAFGTKLTAGGSLASISDLNTDGDNVVVSTSSKSTALNALSVQRSGSVVASIGVTGDAGFTSVTSGGSPVWTHATFDPSQYVPGTGGSVSGSLSVSGSVSVGGSLTQGGYNVWTTGNLTAPLVPATPTTAPTSVDWNSLTTPGWYQYLLYGADGSGNQNPNGPPGVSAYFYLNVCAYAGANVTQVAYPYLVSDSIYGTIWMRSRYSGTWSSWSALPSLNFNDSRYVNAAGDSMTGNLYGTDVYVSDGFWLNAYGTNGLDVGSGDGASFGTYNFALNGQHGMGMLDRNSMSIKGVYDFQQGAWIVSGSYSTADGSAVLSSGAVSISGTSASYYFGDRSGVSSYGAWITYSTGGVLREYWAAGGVGSTGDKLELDYAGNFSVTGVSHAANYQATSDGNQGAYILFYYPGSSYASALIQAGSAAGSSYAGNLTFTGSSLQFSGDININENGVTGQGDNHTHFNLNETGVNYVRGNQTYMSSPTYFNGGAYNASGQSVVYNDGGLWSINVAGSAGTTSALNGTTVSSSGVASNCSYVMGYPDSSSHYNLFSTAYLYVAHAVSADSLTGLSTTAIGAVMSGTSSTSPPSGTGSWRYTNVFTATGDTTYYLWQRYA